MILSWKTLREECPLAVQIIEKKTNFKYNPAYHTLVNESNDEISYAHLEGFFDDHGWFMTVYPMGFPMWNGIITDTQGARVYDNPAQFEDGKNRNYAKTMLAGIAIKFFEEQAKGMFKVPENGTVLDVSMLCADARDKTLEHITYEDLSVNGSGLMAVADFCGIRIGSKIKVLKNKEKMPFIGMIIHA